LKKRSKKLPPALRDAGFDHRVQLSAAGTQSLKWLRRWRSGSPATPRAQHPGKSFLVLFFKKELFYCLFNT
jgi:hypothetical protein